MSQKRPILLLSILLRTGNFIRQVCGVLDFLRMYRHRLLLYAADQTKMKKDALSGRIASAHNPGFSQAPGWMLHPRRKPVLNAIVTGRVRALPYRHKPHSVIDR